MWLLVWYGAASLVTGGVYWRDKAAARRGSWRVRERTLHLLELLGGWPGAMLARGVLRHKTRDWRFLMVSWGIVAVHAAGWGAWWLWR